MLKKKLLILLISALILTTLSSCSEAEKNSSSDASISVEDSFKTFRNLRTGWRLYDRHYSK